MAMENLQFVERFNTMNSDSNVRCPFAMFVGLEGNKLESWRLNGWEMRTLTLVFGFRLFIVQE